MLGGIVAAAILDALTPGELGVQARLGTNVSRTRGLFIEMFATAGLCIVVLMLAAGEYSSLYWKISGEVSRLGVDVVPA